MQSSAEHIPSCQHILNHSANPYALLLASTALKSLITSHWNNYDTSQHIQIRDYVLNYLAERGTTLQDFVLKSLVQLLCRITKLGWFDDHKHREIVGEVARFLTASIDHCVLGLRLYKALVEELNVPISGRTLTQHRKTAVSFRDQCLLEVFQKGVTMLQHLAQDAVQGASPEQKTALTAQALELLVMCLQYDFIGTNPDESGDDVGTIQVPSSWRGVIQEPQTMVLLLQFYRSCEPPTSSFAMSAVVLLSSVRRSLFQSDAARGTFLAQIMTAIRDVLQHQVGLQHPQNYHEFCRLLGRLKANYQLSELVKTAVYAEWIELVAAFSEQSFRQWQLSGNSMQYILQLWVRLVAAVPYVNPDASGTQPQMRQLESCVVRVVRSYVESMLQAAATCARDESLEDPLSNAAQLREQLERLPHLFRFQYATLAEFLATQCFDPCLARYQQLTVAADQAGGGPAANARGGLGGAAAGLGAGAGRGRGVVGGERGGGAAGDDTELSVRGAAGVADVHGRGDSQRRDVELGARGGPRTARWNARAARLPAGDHDQPPHGGFQRRAEADERLELSLTFFLGHFRKAYLLESGSVLAMGAMNAAAAAAAAAGGARWRRWRGWA